jgi:hypothetical protein
LSIADLTRYFVPLSSGSNSKPSTDESENVMDIVVHQEKEQDVGKETENSTAAEQVEEANGDSRTAEQVEVEDIDVNENFDVQQDEGIQYFGLDDIKFDPGLRIPIDQFHPNNRYGVKFSYLEKGPTQPTRHKFPRDRDDRSFRQIGIRNLIGWNIVWTRIRHIASAAIFLKMTRCLKILVTMYSPNLAMAIGKMWWLHSVSMLVGHVAFIIIQRQLA